MIQRGILESRPAIQKSQKMAKWIDWFSSPSSPLKAILYADQENILYALIVSKRTLMTEGLRVKWLPKARELARDKAYSRTKSSGFCFLCTMPCLSVNGKRFYLATSSSQTVQGRP